MNPESKSYKELIEKELTNAVYQDAIISTAKETINPITNEPKKKKVAIIGFAPSWKEVPWEDPDMEFWTLNEAYRLLQTCKEAVVDRWFEIHNLERPPKNDPEHIEFLNKLEIPFYTLKKWDFINNKNQIPFPFDDICKWLKDKGHIGSNYFTNSISWMLGLAIMEGFEEIHIYGVDMAVDSDKTGNSEYSYQKPSCEYLLGVAEKYAKVYIPSTSDLLMCAQRYAVDNDNERYVYIKKQLSTWEDMNKQANQQLQQLQLKEEEIKQQVINRSGAIQGYRTLLRKRL